MYLLTTMQHSHRRVFFHKGINKSPLKYRQIPAKSLPLHLQLQHSQHKEALWVAHTIIATTNQNQFNSGSIKIRPCIGHTLKRLQSILYSSETYKLILMKNFLLTLLLTFVVGISSAQTEHMKFKGIPMEGTLRTFTGQLRAQLWQYNHVIQRS